MEQVSRKIEGGIESAYFDVQYRPSIDHSNFKLNLKCSSLLTYMALADITRKEEQINNLQEKFLETLSECKTEEELKNLAVFLETISKVGGYASTFYSNNISLISSQGKEYAQQKLKEIKDEREKPVSSRIDGGIQSAYFDIQYRPSEDKSNFKLNLNCSSLLTYMALADITRKEEQINKLQEKFLEALSECKTEEEIRNLSRFIREVSKTGGYAVKFYNNNVTLINKSGVIDAKKELEVRQEEKKRPVSSRIDGGIESAYFDVRYRPKGGMEHIDIACSSLLTYMALADITRKEEQINNLMLKFCEILSKCKTPEDFSNLTTFMNITANVGGYAMEFNSKVNGLINQDGKNRAQQYIKNVEKQKKVNADNLEDFKETYARLNMALVELKESSMKDDEEVAYLLRKYNELQSDLYDFNGTIDKNFISQCDEQIEAAINYLKGLYRSLDEIKSSSRGL